MTSTAVVSANETDPDPGNNSTTMWTTVISAPTLSMTRLNNTLQISWLRQPNPGYRLQVADSLNPANWTDVGATPQIVNDQNVVTVGIAGNTKYYRLRSP
jgi:hypothetical protein